MNRVKILSILGIVASISIFIYLTYISILDVKTYSQIKHWSPSMNDLIYNVFIKPGLGISAVLLLIFSFIKLKEKPQTTKDRNCSS